MGVIVPDKQHTHHALEILRVLLVYAHALLTKPKYFNARQALRVLYRSQQAMDGWKDREEEADTGLDLSNQEYKHHLYKSIAFAALGHKYDAVAALRMAASKEQATAEYTSPLLVSQHNNVDTKGEEQKGERFRQHLSV